MNRVFQFEYKLYGRNDLNPTHGQLVDAAKRAQAGAYAPYSQFTVGAAILLADNQIIAGSNQENAAYPSGLCAERVALFFAMSANPEATIAKVAVYAGNAKFPVQTPVSPCGACRQCLIEYELRQSTPIEIILAGDCNEIVVIPSAKYLLPLHFEESRLKK
ncbi:MAG: cytidine deaminase [Flavobacteriales bacterium]